jgi:hypothetical protein
MIEQRSGLSAGACGSVYEQMGSDDVEAMLQSAEWLPYEHPFILEGCRAFIAKKLPGRMGIRAICDLPADVRITLADPKDTGFVEATIDDPRFNSMGDEVDFTVLIVGNLVGDHDGHKVVFTFHPGPPIQPSRVPARGMTGRVVDPDTAMAMGITWAKIIR